MSVIAEALEDPIIQWVKFHLEGETYGVNVMQVQEVLRMTEIAPVPGSPEYVLGIINLRGKVVTVMDTRLRFGLALKPVDQATRILIIESNETIIGILVDSVAEVVNLRASQIDSTPNIGNEEKAKYIQGVFSQEKEILILIDLQKLLDDDEFVEASTS